MSDDITLALAIARVPGMDRGRALAMVEQCTKAERRRGLDLARQLEKWDGAMRDWMAFVGDRIAQDQLTAES